VIDYPLAIDQATFLEDYPQVHKKFFAAIMETDILFVMNEDKKGVK